MMNLGRQVLLQSLFHIGRNEDPERFSKPPKFIHIASGGAWIQIQSARFQSICSLLLGKAASLIITANLDRESVYTKIAPIM